MVNYKCERCCKEYSKKSHYVQHKNRKIPCKIVTPNSTNLHQNNTEKKDNKVQEPEILTPILTLNNKKYICNYCKKGFVRNWTLFRHLEERCKIKKQQIEEKENIFNTLIEKVNKLEKDNKELKEKMNKLNKSSNKTINNIKNNTHNNTQNNNIETQNNFITINAYGKEDLSHISEKTWQSIMNKCFDSVPQLVGYIHYDDDKPENHNVYISNIKSNYVITYNGNNWILQEKDKILDDIYTTKIELLEDKLIELDDHLDESAKRSLKKFLDKQEDNDIENMIKEKIKLRLYNNKKKPLKARRIMEK